MSNEEIDKLLSMLDTNLLEEVKKFLLKEKEQNIVETRQKFFEKYMCNDGMPWFYDNNYGTIIHIREDQVIFSNYYSIYFVNKNLLNITSPKIIKNMTSSKIRKQYKITEVDIDCIEKYEKKLESFSSIFRPISFMEKASKTQLRVSTYRPHSITKILSEGIFSSKEIEYAQNILGNPEFKLGLDHPILYGENEIGKVYILGFK